MEDLHSIRKQIRNDKKVRETILSNAVDPKEFILKQVKLTDDEIVLKYSKNKVVPRNRIESDTMSYADLLELTENDKVRNKLRDDFVDSLAYVFKTGLFVKKDVKVLDDADDENTFVVLI